MVIIERDCVISGGGPAGMVLGYLLARAGVRVTVLEKHADFFRDFRGDTIHPSTIDTLTELGLREKFLALPLSRLTTLDVVLGQERITMIDFTRLPPPNNFLVFAPQWDLLNFIATEGRALPNFELRMGTAATALLRDGDEVFGVRATGPDGELELRAPLTVAADGRHSTLRDAAKLVPDELGVPLDVLWFSLPKPEENPPDTLGYVTREGAVLTIPRSDHYQSGTLIPKGTFEQLKREGLPAFRARISKICPFLSPVVDSLQSWEQVKLLSVQLNRLPRWHLPGFIAIGDAAHAMSPVGGVGINYAIQDAVALANLLAGDLAHGEAPEEKLAALQARREKPVQKMQAVQRIAHKAIAKAAAGKLAPKWLFRLVNLLSPTARGFTARFIGIGLLPEHVDPSLLRHHE